MEQFIGFLLTHWVLSLAFIVVLIFLGINELVNLFFGVPKLNCHHLTSLINRGGVELVDLRAEGDFTTGHILGAKNIPHREITEQVAKLSREKPTILVDANGQQGATVGARLRKLGFVNVMYLAGGFASWRADGLPQVKGK